MVEYEGYIDTNIFIYWLVNHPVFGEKAYQWVKRVEEAPKSKYVTSALTIYQILVTVAGLTNKNLRDQLVEDIVNAITSLRGLTIIPLTKKDIIQAISLMGEYRLDYEDALHLATALRSKAKEMISNDQDFDRTPLKRRFA